MNVAMVEQGNLSSHALNQASHTTLALIGLLRAPSTPAP